MAIKQWLLKRGDKDLGRLVAYEFDFPWIQCRFEPTAAFAQLKPLFDRELELLKGDEISDEWDATYQAILENGLSLECPDSDETISDFLLHIRGADAWFRY